MTPWYKQSPSEVIQALRSSERGLSSEEAARRLVEYGRNTLPEGKTENMFVRFARQFRSPLIYILFASAAIVFYLGQMEDALIIFFVLIFNAIVGAVQEGKAEDTLRALKKFSETKAEVLREGVEDIVPDTDVVSGDIIALNAGEKIPADARIIAANNLKVSEAALTGESEPVHKIAEEMKGENLAPADQKNMVFKGTHVVAGNGKAVVTATGTGTAIGAIAKEVIGIDREMPLEKNIASLSRLIIIAVSLMSAVLFALGINAGNTPLQMFAVVVSLAVSVIPEGLPIVVTLVLATGVFRMGKRNALVKKLQAVEALGQAKIIAVDKTGTITKNELTVQKVFVDGKMFEIGGAGYDPRGEVRLDGPATDGAGTIVDAVNHPELLFAGKIAGYCADAKVALIPETGEWRVTGDPTEAALLVLSQKLGFHKDELESESPLVTEIPFDYSTKYHATVHNEAGKKFLTVVGAPEVILSLSGKIWRDGKHSELTAREKKELEEVAHTMAGEGLRVIAFAETSDVPDPLDPEKVKNITFVGFYGMKDALRPEAKDAVAHAVLAGIGVVMITGDYALTALSIAKEAGIYHEGEDVLTGKDIDTLSEEELAEKLPNTTVFARVTPEHKLKIVNAYKRRGVVIGMTGDGVNDAPSLVAADLGIAMGRGGTEVAKEAADIVLLDDNFASIVAAVEEGRNIYKTIRKVIFYLFSTSLGEVATIAGAILLGLPLPLLAAQIIWLNLVTDGFLTVALAMEPKEKGLLTKRFKKPSKYIIDKSAIWRMLLMGLTMGIGALYLFSQYVPDMSGEIGVDIDMTKAWTISLTTLAVFQWFNAWNCRFDDKSIFRANPLSNLWLIGATGVVTALQLLAIYHPVFQNFLHTAPLSLSEWLTILPIALTVIIVEEVRKLWVALRKKP